MLLCYANHHDEAYDWARRRRLDVHPKTGAAQLVELRETVQEIAIPKYVEVERTAPSKPALFAGTPESELLGCGVPLEWIADVRKADEDDLLVLAQHLPAEAGEALLNLAFGIKPASAASPAPGADPFAHPDAQRRFRVMRSAEDSNALWIIRGISGLSFCTRVSGVWWNATITVRLALLGPQVRERRLSRCTAPRSWFANIRSRGYC